mgnify:CR=1 FL=1
MEREENVNRIGELLFKMAVQIKESEGSAPFSEDEAKDIQAKIMPIADIAVDIFAVLLSCAPQKEILTANLKQGDTVVIKLQQYISGDLRQRMADDFKQGLPAGVNVLCLDGGRDIQALQFEAAGGFYILGKHFPADADPQEMVDYVSRTFGGGYTRAGDLLKGTAPAAPEKDLSPQARGDIDGAERDD